MFSILPEIRIYAVYNNLKHVLLPMMSGMAVFLNSLINISKYSFIRNFMAVYTVKFFINYISTFSCEGLVRLKWAIAVKIRYPLWTTLFLEMKILSEILTLHHVRFWKSRLESLNSMENPLKLLRNIS